jgi:hypothetical protein
VNCVKCNAEIPDGSQFCLKCGKPQEGTGTKVLPPRSNTPAWAIFFVVLSVGLLVYLAIHAYHDSESAIKPRSAVTAPLTNTAADNTAATPTLPPTPQHHFVNLTNGALTVNAAAYSFYTFSVPPGVQSVMVSGHFTASGGSGNDIMVYLLDQDGFVNLKNGHPARTYFNSGKVTQSSIGAVLPNFPASYYLVFDNRFSLITPKAVQVTAVLGYMQ